MTTELWIACALVLVIEGMLPALNPKLYRRMVQLMSERDDRSLRIFGLVMMILGAIIVFIVK